MELDESQHSMSCFGQNIAKTYWEGNVVDILGTEKKFRIASLPISIAWTTFFAAK